METSPARKPEQTVSTVANDPCPTPWAFDDDVALVFDQMLARSIPNYDEMRRVVTQTAMHYRQPETAIMDLGSSRGEAVADLIRKYGACNRFHLVETSAPMLAQLRIRYGGYPPQVVRLHNMDLRRELPHDRASVVLSVLTLQFIPITYRARILQTIHDRLLTGGAFILVEKCLGRDEAMDQLHVQLYHALKARNGYTPAEIEAKAAALEHQLVPLKASWNEDLLRSTGFSHTERLWQWMNFVAWVATK